MIFSLFFYFLLFQYPPQNKIRIPAREKNILNFFFVSVFSFFALFCSIFVIIVSRTMIGFVSTLSLTIVSCIYVSTLKVSVSKQRIVSLLTTKQVSILCVGTIFIVGCTISFWVQQLVNRQTPITAVAETRIFFNPCFQ